jgi:uncharacterized protein YbjT (DUF2867 family)
VTRVLVVGAAGLRGRSVVARLLEMGRFGVRVLVGPTDSEPAAQLRGAGAEVVAGDLENRASLREALKGCDAACALVEPPAARAMTEARNLINAVAGSEVEFFILCTSHAEAEAYARSLELPAAFVRAAREDDAPSAADAFAAAVAGMFVDPGEFIGRTIVVGAPA